MGAAEVAAAYSRQQSALAQQIAAETAKLWNGIDPADLDASWAAALPRANALVSGGMVLAASTADSYLDDVLDVQGIDPTAEAPVDPRTFGQTASDGRPLQSLLEQPLIGTKTALGAGASPVEALAGGLLQLDMIVRTQLADAGRTATGVALTARRHVGGYIRMLNPPSCNRCAVLAGKFYEWNAGFLRHPRCDCRHIPTNEAVSGDLRTNPRAYFDSLTVAEQNRLFTNAGAEAIRDGADIGQVVNAGRKGSVYTAGGRNFTNESTGRRGVARGKQRLTPEQIYVDAAGDREKAIALLRENRYLFGEPAARTPAVTVPAPKPVVIPKQRTASSLGKFHNPGDDVADLAAAAKTATSGGAVRSKLAGGASADTELITLPDGRKLVTKRGSDWGDKSPEAQADVRHQAEAEQMASLVGRTIGAPVLRVYRSDVDRVWMEFSEGSVIGDLADDATLSLVRGRDGQMLGLLDHLVGNTDRNGGNILVHEGRLIGIDHGWSWTPSTMEAAGPAVQDERIRPAAHFSRDRAWIDNPLTQRDVEVLRDRLNGLRSSFDRIGRGEWLDYSLARLDLLARHARGTVDLLG